ncbi:hypothetical protein C900_00966 [Fulvivirga imtechensis AK7]|uniref:Type I restriction modification DNA specificity domain-containing protein n=1 Tax=Fulvivirga imtechensis AK7 TaxID=1237149 RepID=L8JZG3_9BACT|nr:restriction endonuclease subunit S [Fulvivirga imtechensis]ELR72587.1 hypothetical protein C900_00966 [Fulvivirga imtechensis AK7]
MKIQPSYLKSVLLALFSGYSFRGKVQDDPQGDTVVIQMKDLENNYTEIGSALTRVDSTSISSKHHLQKGDVLFISKGANNFALVYDLNFPRAVAASAFFVLRPDPAKILPGYLAWYLNQKPVQQYLVDNRAGTYIPNVNKTALLGIEIRLPEKNIQEKIVKVDILRKREYLLIHRLLEKREQLISNKLLNIIN